MPATGGFSLCKNSGPGKQLCVPEDCQRRNDHNAGCIKGSGVENYDDAHRDLDLDREARLVAAQIGM